MMLIKGCYRYPWQPAAFNLRIEAEDLTPACTKKVSR